MKNGVRDSLGFIHHVENSPGNAPHTLLLLHGTGGDESDLLDLGRQLAPNAALLSPRGKVLEQGAPRFFRRLREGVFDIPDLIHRANELADFVLAAASEYELDITKICAVGFSNGANVAAAMLLLRPEVLRYAALLRPMVPLHPQQSPDLNKHKVLVAAGRSDPMVSTDQTNALVKLLKSYGADVTLATANAGHQLSQSDLTAVSTWMSSEGGFLRS